jgi:predicted Fe-S protein YdhL (DUF1289 family)
MSLKKNEEYIPSPCIRVCNFDYEKEICLSCKRTLDEISNWLRMSNDEKKQVLKRIEETNNNERK